MRLALPIDETLWARMKALDAACDFCIRRVTTDQPVGRRLVARRVGMRRVWRVQIYPRTRIPEDGVEWVALRLEEALEGAVKSAEAMLPTWTGAAFPPRRANR